MPSFAEVLSEPERWALADYVRSLQVPMPPERSSAGPLEAGRRVAEKYACRACHVLDDGEGGNVGPDLRVSARKLRGEWVRSYLADPRAGHKIYPGRRTRMPRFPLSAEEIDVLVDYLREMGRHPERPEPLPQALRGKELDEARGLFVSRCSSCHNLGHVIETPFSSRAGPDLIFVAERLDYAFARPWLTDPVRVDPLTSMRVWPPLAPREVELVRRFLWQTSLGARP